MKRLKNNKGITLMELLAVVVILGILTTVATGAISKLIDKSNENYYKNQKDNIALAAQSYLSDNRGLLPLKKGDDNAITIYLVSLTSNGYIKTVKDKNGKNCTDTIVKVTRKGKNNYEYKVCLECPNYDDYDDCSS